MGGKEGRGGEGYNIQPGQQFDDSCYNLPLIIDIILKMSAFCVKKALRSKYLAIRKDFILREGPLHYSALKANLQSLLSQLNSHQSIIIGSYIPLPEKQIIPPHLPPYQYAFPYFQAKKNKTDTPKMEFKIHSENDSYRQRVYGIKIPTKSATTVHPNLILVPLTCFHPISKQRIGYGGGYYDEYIKESRLGKQKSIFIGVGLQCVKQESMFWQQKDEGLDFVITERDVY